MATWQVNSEGCVFNLQFYQHFCIPFLINLKKKGDLFRKSKYDDALLPTNIFSLFKVFFKKSNCRANDRKNSDNCVNNYEEMSCRPDNDFDQVVSAKDSIMNVGNCIDCPYHVV